MSRLRSIVPTGRPLPEAAWAQRHRALTWVLWLHVAGLLIFGVCTGYGFTHVLGELMLTIGVAAGIASSAVMSRRIRTLAASFGLVMCSVMLVHLSNGVTEAHFHFFIAIGLLTLYEEWLPFILAFVVVVLHHGVLGVIEPHHVYDHKSAWDHPWRWAFIHGISVAAASVTNLSAWRINEQTRSEAEVQLRAERDHSMDLAARLSLVLDATAEGVFGVLPSGVLSFVNPAGARLLREEKFILEGQTFHRLVHPDGDVAISCDDGCQLADAGRSAATVRCDEQLWQRTDGTTFWASYTVSPLIHEGLVVGSVVNVSDVTDQRQAAIELAESYAREHDVVLQLQKLDETKSSFIANVSHELRTPMTSILGYLEMLRDDLDAPVSLASRLRMIEAMERNSQRLQGLIENMLAVNAIETVAGDTDMEPVGIAQLLKSSVTSVLPKAEAQSLRVHVDVPDDLGELLGDAKKLERALLNVLGNAVKFTPAEGTVTVVASRDAEAVRIQISDTGVGIPPSEQAKVFDRFFRSSISHEQEFQGAGLGLTIAKDVLDRHQGTIAVTSAPGAGSTFTITLPVARTCGLQRSGDADAANPDAGSVAKMDRLEGAGTPSGSPQPTGV